MKAMSMYDFIRYKFPERKYIISNGILVPEGKMIIYGRWWTWKSMLAMHTAVTLASGKDWFGFKVNPVTSYLAQIEMPAPEFQDRVIQYSIGNRLELKNCFMRSEPYIKLDRDYGFNDIVREMEECHPGVLIIDPINHIMSGHLTDDYDVRQLTDRIDILAAKYHLSIILIGHNRKQILVDGRVYESAEDIFGSSYFLTWCDTAIKVTANEVDDASDNVNLNFAKVRFAKERVKPITIHINRADLTFNLIPTVTQEEITFRQGGK